MHNESQKLLENYNIFLNLVLIRYFLGVFENPYIGYCHINISSIVRKITIFVIFQVMEYSLNFNKSISIIFITYLKFLFNTEKMVQERVK